MLIDDVVQAWRRVRSRPATMIGAAAMLALAGGLTTAMFASEMRQLPGVQDAVMSYGIPPDGSAIHFGGGCQSDVPGAAALTLTVESYRVDANFFTFYGIPRLRGRTFQTGDSPTEVIVGERLAALL